MTDYEVPRVFCGLDGECGNALAVVREDGPQRAGGVGSA